MFAFGRINFKILDLNKLRLFRFRMSESSILEEVVFYNKLLDLARTSCSKIRIIFRNNIEKIVRRLFCI